MEKNKIIFFGFATIFLLSVFVITNGFGLFNSNPTGYSTKTVEGFVTIPLSDITTNAKWYKYGSSNNAIRFFVVRANDGSIKTGFDACDVCYRTRKGYRQEGDYMVCNNCGNRYPISGLGTENKNPGGCWPGYLPSYVDGSNLVIKNSDLENGRSRFI